MPKQNKTVKIIQTEAFKLLTSVINEFATVQDSNLKLWEKIKNIIICGIIYIIVLQAITLFVLVLNK